MKSMLTDWHGDGKLAVGVCFGRRFWDSIQFDGRIRNRLVLAVDNDSSNYGLGLFGNSLRASSEKGDNTQ